MKVLKVQEKLWYVLAEVAVCLFGPKLTKQNWEIGPNLQPKMGFKCSESEPQTDQFSEKGHFWTTQGFQTGVPYFLLENR